MAQTVRIDPETYDLLSQLAEEDRVTLQEELTRSVKARRKERFFEQMTEGYGAMTADELAEDAAELALWDTTLADGSEPE
jgi:hypothetical protein